MIKIKLKFMLFKIINVLYHLKNKKEKGGKLAKLNIISKFNKVINLVLYIIKLKFILK